MKATDLLRQVHAEIDELFASLGSAWDVDMKRVVFLHLREALLAYAHVEEAVLYPAAARLPGSRAARLVERGLDEHLRMRALLLAVNGLDVDEPEFDEEMDVLRDLVRSQARAEEEGLLPLLGEHLGERGLERLGRDFADAPSAR